MPLPSFLNCLFGGDGDRSKFRRFYTVGEPVDLTQIQEFRNDAFPQGEPTAWLDRPDAEEAINRKLAEGAFDTEAAEACRFRIRNGYLIRSGLIDDATLDATWAAYEEALASGALGERRYANEARTLDERQLDPHVRVPTIRALQQHPAILAWTDLLLGRKTAPFQTIMGHAASQQRALSDSIHMTTYPLGYLVANWVAFEDISPASGPLDYYPGSHRLPYLLSAEVGIAPPEFKQKGYAIYSEKYEPVIQRACEEAGLTKQTFLAKTRQEGRRSVLARQPGARRLAARRSRPLAQGAGLPLLRRRRGHLSRSLGKSVPPAPGRHVRANSGVTRERAGF